MKQNENIKLFQISSIKLCFLIINQTSQFKTLSPYGCCTQLQYVMDLNSLSNNEQVNIFWNNNHCFFIQSPILDQIYSQILSERLQYNLLYDHQKVLTQMQTQLSSEYQNDEYGLKGLIKQWEDIESQQFVVIVLDEYLQKAIFSKEQAKQLKLKLSQRKDFKKLCCFLLSNIDKRLTWQFIYLFYFSLKMLKQEKYEQKQKLQNNQILKFISNEQNEQNIERVLKQKFKYLRFLNKFCININIIIITMMRAIKGLFINPFYKQMFRDCQLIQVNQPSFRKKKQKKIKKKKYITRNKSSKSTLSQF